ncbi:hypothetical protein A7D27_20595 [Pseudomonas sp. 1D4]|uniref:hypothetical protein n=1 Tax=Pseudomonadaceae TaxID=135621 RepID=UPI00084BA5FD|nr:MULTISPECIES: hypothetical protein [Pseudomonas]OEC38819.1 hypothetical protein A7D27_20595 [Pseudomonas sp. 1D4]OEC61026.1 hypothetical protein A9G05_04570 [Pseudomonas sp. ENNP23]
MNRLISLFLALFVSGFALHGVAEEVDETPPKYIESATLILSLTNKSGEPAKGYVLSTACQTCAPQRFEINDRTKVYLRGEPTDFANLGLKIDWQGSVFYTPTGLPTVTELFLN